MIVPELVGPVCKVALLSHPALAQPEEVPAQASLVHLLAHRGPELRQWDQALKGFHIVAAPVHLELLDTMNMNIFLIFLFV